MGQDNQLVTDDKPPISQFYITDITLESTNGTNDDSTSLILADSELCVFGIPGSVDGKAIVLFNSSPGRRGMQGSIELPADTNGIDCVVTCHEHGDLGYMHLDPLRPEHDRKQKLETFDAQINVTVSWEVIQIRSGHFREADEIAGHFQDHALERFRAYRHAGDLADILAARLAMKRAVDLTPQGHVNMPGRLTDLGNVLTHRFERTGELGDIVEAISLQQKAVALTPQDHGDLPSILSNLGNAFMSYYGQTDTLSHLTQAISFQKKAAELAPDGYIGLPAILNNLGTALNQYYRRTDTLSYLSEAVTAHRKAVELIPQSHEDVSSLLIGLGDTLSSLFERVGDPQDITDAIASVQRAVELTPQGHPDLPSRLRCLGGLLTDRFQQTGDLVDIDHAISVRQKAVDITPLGKADLHSQLMSLGDSFAHRFVQTGILSDINEAIALQQRAVELLPQDHRSLRSHLNNLGISLRCRFEHTNELLDIAESISVEQKALKLHPQGVSHLAFNLNNLGTSLLRRFERTGELSEIAEAIAVHQQAVDLIPQDPSLLCNLGVSLRGRFEHTGDLSDISKAIATHRKSVELTSQTHAARPSRLTSLGISLSAQYGRTGDIRELYEAIACYKGAATSIVGSSKKTRLNAAQLWARTLIQHDSESPEILVSFQVAVGLVALIAGLEQTVQGRYTALENTTCFALEAAAAACALDRPDKALEWLEQGRCHVWSQLNNLRTPLDYLRLHDEDLVKEIADVARRLEHAGSSRGQSPWHLDMSLSEKISLENEGRSQMSLARKWDSLLTTVRAIPGFETFLAPPRCSTLLQDIPDSGPIIVINVDERRCDAIALLPGLDEPLHIPLPNFSIEKASAYRTDLDAQLRAGHLRTREVEDITGTDIELLGRGFRPLPVRKQGEDSPVHRVLHGLWDEVVKPTLDALGFSSVDQTSGKVPPRLWWCPTGPLSFLPLHAAGVYQGSECESALDYVVSSYTPTVRALTDRVKNHKPVDPTASGLLLTSQPSVIGSVFLPGTTEEVRSISNISEENGVRVLKLEGDELSVAGCIERMQEFSSIHLACHATQNATEPLQSRFLFHQGPLDLGTILESNLKNADLAFLSACQTSTGQEKLSDEAVHLAAGMLAAGYRRVIGTMWSIGDAPAQQVATTFYEYLFSHRDETAGATFDGTHSAVALHHATQQLRKALDDSEHSLLTWIPFVHFGL
ncbi:CHAT domain-containing protein [Ephemerocybe angulata]|uniref:CHAT domain-containing protein n=1 Tax=Ephemerocybe angulata TaxID=980116 RepID=A0A8H6M3V1_9AGAR|nr:CHAT domain-containing protein [Tulosesus angulatus]